MKTLLTLLVGLMIASSNVHAIALTFKLDIFSSGADIYACNAGLAHGDYEGRVCYDRTNPRNSCNPNLCEEGQACNCVCTGGISGRGDGEFRLDYFNATFRDWADHGEVGSNPGSKYVEAKRSNSSFNQLFDNDQAFGKELTSLTFNLGSERYGAVYFLDVCLRASQISYDYQGATINWAMDRQVTITDLSTNGYNYEELSGLLVMSTYSCKKKDGGVVSGQSSWSAFNSSDLINYAVKNLSKDLKDCKVRYYFKESNTVGLNSIRKWNMQKARVCTYTSFNESEL